MKETDHKLSSHILQRSSGTQEFVRSSKQKETKVIIHHIDQWHESLWTAVTDFVQQVSPEGRCDNKESDLCAVCIHFSSLDLCTVQGRDLQFTFLHAAVLPPSSCARS